jgi:TPR repeat protein
MKQLLVLCMVLCTSFLFAKATPYKIAKNECSANNKCSCWKLGDFYRKGVAVKLNIQKAKVSYEKGCKMGCPYACFELGQLYHHGRGVKIDLGLAQTHYTKGCMLGNKKSCNLIKALEKRNTKVVHKSVTTHRLESQCSPNNTHACYTAGYAYMVGGAVVQNSEKGIALLQKACDFNYKKACQVVKPFVSKEVKKKKLPVSSHTIHSIRPVEE